MGYECPVFTYRSVEEQHYCLRYSDHEIYGVPNLYRVRCPYCMAACDVHEDDSMSIDGQHGEEVAICRICGR
jgi:hypothetical protein